MRGLLITLLLIVSFVSTSKAETDVKTLTEQEAMLIRDINGCSTVYYNLSLYLLTTRHITEMFDPKFDSTLLKKSFNTAIANYNKLNGMYDVIEQKLISEGYLPEELDYYEYQGTYGMANIVSGMTVQMFADPENAKDVLVRLIAETDRCDNLYLKIN